MKAVFIVLFIVAIRVDVFSQDITGKWKESVDQSKMYFTVYTFTSDGLFVRETHRSNANWSQDSLRHKYTIGVFRIQNDTIFLSINKIETQYTNRYETGDMTTTNIETDLLFLECYTLKINTSVKNSEKPSVYINGLEYMKMDESLTEPNK